jgi:hypothetical protein
MSIRRIVTFAMVIGFIVPIFWGILSLALMGAKGPWTETYWTIVHVTCPPWSIDVGPVATPILNALLYGAVVGALVFFWKQLHADMQRTD